MWIRLRVYRHPDSSWRHYHACYAALVRGGRAGLFASWKQVGRSALRGGANPPYDVYPSTRRSPPLGVEVRRIRRLTRRTVRISFGGEQLARYHCAALPSTSRYFSLKPGAESWLCPPLGQTHPGQRACRLVIPPSFVDEWAVRVCNQPVICITGDSLEEANFPQQLLRSPQVAQVAQVDVWRVQ